jgi:hypothetical protein
VPRIRDAFDPDYGNNEECICFHQGSMEFPRPMSGIMRRMYRTVFIVDERYKNVNDVDGWISLRSLQAPILSYKQK